MAHDLFRFLRGEGGGGGSSDEDEQEALLEHEDTSSESPDSEQEGQLLHGIRRALDGQRDFLLYLEWVCA